jgi:hypothetical protein
MMRAERLVRLCLVVEVECDYEVMIYMVATRLGLLHLGKAAVQRVICRLLRAVCGKRGMSTGC